MTRKLSRNYSLSVVGLFIAMIVLTALAALAQVAGARLAKSAGGSSLAESDKPLFLWAEPYDTGGWLADSVAVADLNGDGKLDLVVANQCFHGYDCSLGGLVSVLLGNGDGTFQPAKTYGSGGGVAGSVAIADVNGDGKPDLAVANCGAIGTTTCRVDMGMVGVLLGNGDGTFQAALNYESGRASAKSIAVADLNGDHKPDLVAGNSCYPYCNEVGTVGVLLGNGDGTFQPVGIYDCGRVGDSSGAQSVAIADVNGDGSPDLVVANVPGIVDILLGNGDGTFQPAVTHGSGGSTANSVAVADLNDDGKPDLVVGNNFSVGVLLGNGDGIFQPAVTFDSGGRGDFPGVDHSVAVADVDGDGKLDVLIANFWSNNVGVLLGNGDGTFRSPLIYGGGFAPASIALADVNGDGKPDLAVANWALGQKQAWGSVEVRLNNAGVPPTTTSLVSSLNPVVLNKIVTYTATVVSQNGGAVTGKVMFQYGGSTTATVPMENNQAAYSTTYKKGGPYAIIATYSGDLDNAGSTSATLMEYVASVASKTVVTTSGSPSLVGQPVTFTATVTSSHGVIPSGELVAFYDGATAIGTGATANGVATLTTTSLTVKTHTIKAIYSGDSTFKPSTGVLTQIVNKYPTAAVLISSPNPSGYGQAVTFTATVTSAGPTPTGKIRFMDGTTGLGMATLTGGVATLTKSKLAVGTHPITAQYLGDATSDKTTSSVLEQGVQ